MSAIPEKIAKHTPIKLPGSTPMRAAMERANCFKDFDIKIQGTLGLCVWPLVTAVQGPLESPKHTWWICDRGEIFSASCRQAANEVGRQWM